jgi:hypothetical protein
MVIGGVYNLIRHPQYVSLSVCSLGLLLAWPRYLVLISFVTMLFAYYFLARTEEQECEEKFGPSYRDYKNRTHMFLPFRVPGLDKLPTLPTSGAPHILAILGLYAATLLIVVGLAGGLRSVSLNAVTTVYAPNSAALAAIPLDNARVNQILQIAENDERVRQRRAGLAGSTGVKLVNYVLPDEWYLGDIPMNMGGHDEGHIEPENYNPNLYKVIFMQATVSPTAGDVQGKELVLHTIQRIPLFEARVDLAQNKVIEMVEIPLESIRWQGFPTPLF